MSVCLAKDGKPLKPLKHVKVKLVTQILPKLAECDQSSANNQCHFSSGALPYINGSASRVFVGWLIEQTPVRHI
jgi:hypothetical protein